MDAEFCIEAITGFSRVRKMVFSAEKHIWSIAEQIDTSYISTDDRKKSKGVRLQVCNARGLSKDVCKWYRCIGYIWMQVYEEDLLHICDY